MLVQYRNGKRQELSDARAKYLIKIRRANEVRDTYQTRDMADQPTKKKGPIMVVNTVVAETNDPVVKDIARIASGDALDSMDKAKLHALARERGVKVHHMAGADKVREALRAAE